MLAIKTSKHGVMKCILFMIDYLLVSILVYANAGLTLFAKFS